MPFKVMPARVNLNVDEQTVLAPLGAAGAVTWTSSDPAVVTVNSAGHLTAVARGSAVITATTGSAGATSTSSAAVSVWQSSGPNADPSAQSLIAAAQTGGRISVEQALVYHVFARFADARLPAEFQGPSDPASVVSLRHVSGQLPTLSQPTQDLLRPFLLPPIYAESWYAQQIGAAAPSVTVQRVRPMDSGPGCTIAPFATAPARRATAHYNIYAFRNDPNPGEVAMLDYTASVIEQIDAALTGLLQRRPLADTAEECNGGDGALDIYLVPGLGSEEYGEVVPYPGRCENTPAYILINAFAFTALPFDLGVSDSGRVDLAKRGLRTVLTHEVMHAIQYGMDRAAACADYDWIDEGTAQWASDYVFKDDNQEDGFTKLGLNNAYRTGKYYVDYLKGGHRNQIEKANGYTTYIYFQFLARKYGAAAIKALFDAWTSHGSVASLDEALKAAGSNLRDAWPEFGKALWNDVRDNVLTDLRSWDGYDYGMANAATPETMMLDPSGRRNVTLLRANGSSIPPRSLAYERLVFSDDSVAGVMLSNPLHAHPQAQDLRLIAVMKINGQWQAPEDWTGHLSKFLCRDKQSERLQELVLIVSNSASDPNAAPVTLPSDPPLAISASNVGCWKWQGNATIEHFADTGVASEHQTSRATDVMFEPPSPYLGGTMTLAVTGGTASGLHTLTSTTPPCNITITGPAKAIRSGDTGLLWFNLDLRHPAFPTQDRKVVLLKGITFIDSTSVAICNGNRTETPAPSTGWTWLLLPLVTHPLNVSTDGRSIEANVTIPFPNARTVHSFRFSAMRE